MTAHVATSLINHPTRLTAGMTFHPGPWIAAGAVSCLVGFELVTAAFALLRPLVELIGLNEGFFWFLFAVLCGAALAVTAACFTRVLTVERRLDNGDTDIGS